MSALVSVVMPAYNCEKFVGSAIESIQAQSVPDWELIIVDDCSVDGTARVIESYLDDCRIRLLKNEKNQGAAVSRNRAIEVAGSKFIAFLDADDLWAPKKLEKQIAFMKNNNAAFSFSGYDVINEAGEQQYYLPARSHVNFRKMLRHNYIGCLTAMYDAEMIGKWYFPLLRKRQDYALWLKIISCTSVAWGINEPLAKYRNRSGTISESKIDAVRYYWRVVRQVVGKPVLPALYYLFCYLFIMVIKKASPSLFSRVFIR